MKQKGKASYLERGQPFEDAFVLIGMKSLSLVKMTGSITKTTGLI